MPILGQTGIDNLWLNVGHGALGFTLALGAAEALAAAISGRPAPIDLSSFGLSAL
jgi:D-amino-acid dehydrogenase